MPSSCVVEKKTRLCTVVLFYRVRCGYTEPHTEPHRSVCAWCIFALNKTAPHRTAGLSKNTCAPHRTHRFSPNRTPNHTAPYVPGTALPRTKPHRTARQDYQKLYLHRTAHTALHRRTAIIIQHRYQLILEVCSKTTDPQNPEEDHSHPVTLSRFPRLDQHEGPAIKTCPFSVSHLWCA